MPVLYPLDHSLEENDQLSLVFQTAQWMQNKSDTSSTLSFRQALIPVNPNIIRLIRNLDASEG
jgi:hypothetical protein